jgi:hypothetical protein
MLRRVAVVRTDVSEELSAYFIRVTIIGELGSTLAVTSNRRTLRRNACDNVTIVSHLSQTRELGYRLDRRENYQKRGLHFKVSFLTLHSAGYRARNSSRAGITPDA